jgi:L-serine dehydratase
MSILELFTIGIGPSSSHTVGPMRAAARFVAELQEAGHAEKVARLRCDLYGSLAATGKGHGTDRALILGFMGEQPETTDIDRVESRLENVGATKSLTTPWGVEIDFDPKRDLDFKRLKPLPGHPNGMHFTAIDAAGGC